MCRTKLQKNLPNQEDDLPELRLICFTLLVAILVFAAGYVYWVDETFGTPREDTTERIKYAPFGLAALVERSKNTYRNGRFVPPTKKTKKAVGGYNPNYADVAPML